MIYLFIFMYLLICVILYDVYERKLHLRANYIVLYFLFTLIAGLRWRLGVDTVNYMNFFQYEMPPLSQLSIEYITESRYQPFWLLLNAVCKGLGSFTLVQIFVSAFFHASVFCFLRKSCTKPFTVLTIYYLYSYFYFSMEIMRESLAISCFLFGVTCLNNGKVLKYYIWSLCAFMFHFFAIILFLFTLLTLMRYHLRIKIFVVILLLTVWLVFKIQILTCIITFVPSVVANKLVNYFFVDRYGSNMWRLTGFVYNLFPLLIVSIFFYLYFCVKCKVIFLLKENLWISCVLLYSLLLFLSIDMSILLRFSNYMYFIVAILYASCLYIINFNKVSHSIFILICFCLMFGLRIYMLARPERVFDDYKLRIHGYAEFFPYTSVFDKDEPLERSILHSYWGDK